MTAITVIGDPFPDWQEPIQRHAITDLTRALANVAPRGCSVQFVQAKGTTAPDFNSPLITAVEIPLRVSRLPLLWQASATATPLDDSFVHSHTPLAPLRQRRPGDYTQNTVFVPHTLAWDAPELIGTGSARIYRRFVRRAAKYANVVFVPTHAVAEKLLSELEDPADVRVLPQAAPSCYTAAVPTPLVTLPDAYIVTTATPGTAGRLEWLFTALEHSAALPELVILTGLGPENPALEIPASIRERVHIIPAETGDYTVVSQVLRGAQVLAMPEQFVGVGYIGYAALAHGVPILHTGPNTLSEVVLDAGATAATEDEFISELHRICGTANQTLRLLARDRARGYSWEQTAWQLWETHANL